jgi:formamidopyrimidine-DNA glycosylase
MPELPDVEMARRLLSRALRGARVTGAHTTDRRISRPHAPAAFARALVGRTVRDVSRRGKWLRVLLDDGGRIFSHLGMTGWWVVRDEQSSHERSERARIDVTREDGRTSSVRYLDARRFGRLVVATDEIDEWRELGPDPLAEGIRAEALAVRLGRTRRAVKDALMDQSTLAGIGNILVTEALWRARIDPRSRADALSRTEIARVARALGTELRRELAVREDAEDGEWEDTCSVYGRTGRPCPRCGASIARVVLAGRGTTFCPRCQVRRGHRAK